LNEWQSQFSGKINFLLVYIAEAHATDVWPLGNHVCLSSHKTIKERENAAQLLVSKYDCKLPILLDSMSDEFDNAFSIWPERYYVLKNNLVEHVFKPKHEFGFDHDKMYSLLKKLAEPQPEPIEQSETPNPANKELTVVDEVHQ